MFYIPLKIPNFATIMKKCNNCNTPLLDNARFCHNCGAKVVAASTASPKSKYRLYFKDTASLPHLIQKHFLEAFKERITEEHQEKKYAEYLNRLEKSDFKKRLQLRWNQLAEEAYIIHAKQDNVSENIDNLLSENFNNLLDYFIILECKDLNEFYLPEKILAYQELKQGDFDLSKMVLDFLDLENETETYYTDFIIMPVKKLKNASQAFLFPNKDEKIILIADQTIFGSCKEGFAMTEKGIYWKAHFEDSQSVFYKDLKTIKREKDWLNINDHFFNINPSVNLKMMKLLKKLQRVF